MACVEEVDPEAVVASFEERVDAFFRAEAGKPLVRAAKRAPLAPGRGNYVRHYSYSLMSFAARCLYLGEMIEEANAALAENAQHYLDHPKDINDRDSFHWHGEIVLRLIETFGSYGSGLITAETEALMLEPVWQYASMCSSIGKAEHATSKTWDVYSSENHQVMDFTICWHFSKLAMARPEYADRLYADRASPAEHFAAWNAYFPVYCLERARKGLCVEMMSNHYNAVWAKGLYNFYDFGDAEVSRQAGQLLDLFYAYWAQEQMNGVQGGGRSRVYLFEGMQRGREHDMAATAWLNFGIGERPSLSGHELNAALSGYRVPAVVADIALDIEGRGRYEVRQRPQGLGSQGRPHPQVTEQKTPSRLRTDGGGILRYSYCDPAFIMGTPMCEARPLSDWAAISSQNRWQGVVFPSASDARIIPMPIPADHHVALNSFWSVQSKGCLITQKLKTHKGAGAMQVWISKAGLSEPVVEAGVVFVESEGAYAAIRPGSGAFELAEPQYPDRNPAGTRYAAPSGWAIVLEDEWSPAIVEIMAKSDVQSMDAFKAAVAANAPRMAGSQLLYRSVYGEELGFDTSYQDAPIVDGVPLDYAPDCAFDSPFLQSEYNSGVVTIRKGGRKKVLMFE